MDEMETEKFILDIPFVKYTYYISILIVCTFGIIANGLIVSIVARKKSMQTSLNLFLSVIAVTDITSCITYTVVSMSTLFGFPAFNQSLCHPIVYFAQLEKLLTPIMLATAVITFIFFKEIRVRTIWILILGVSAFAMVCAIPQGYYTTSHKFYHSDDVDDTICVDDWPNQNIEKNNKLICMFIRALALLLSLAVCSIKLKSFRTASSARTISKHLPLLCLIYTVLVTPNLVTESFEFVKLLKLNVFMAITIFVCVFQVTCFVFKPIFYVLCDENFRKELKILMTFCFKRQSNDAYAVYSNETV